MNGNGMGLQFTRLIEVKSCLAIETRSLNLEYNIIELINYLNFCILIIRIFNFYLKCSLFLQNANLQDNFPKGF